MVVSAACPWYVHECSSVALKKLTDSNEHGVNKFVNLTRVTGFINFIQVFLSSGYLYFLKLILINDIFELILFMYLVSKLESKFLLSALFQIEGQ